MHGQRFSVYGLDALRIGPEAGSLACREYDENWLAVCMSCEPAGVKNFVRAQHGNVPKSLTLNHVATEV
jgi:hypothetical protein